MATRAFQIYDRDANHKLDRKEVSRILKEIYKHIDKKKKITEEDVNSYFKIFNC